ncbi:hypothetical protein QEG46_003958 [Stenotrophomonas maltophilia]|nr:hypothetical protein [Stenotrophomonas maltophilia]
MNDEIKRSCYDERPCIPCYTDNGACIGPASDNPSPAHIAGVLVSVSVRLSMMSEVPGYNGSLLSLDESDRDDVITKVDWAISSPNAIANATGEA